MKNGTVHLFFACDDGYIPFLAATLTSLKAHANRNRRYSVKILSTGIRKDYERRILDSLSDGIFDFEFVNISESVERISDMLHTRDYYSKSTYYRLFIPYLYPELDKALYLDCDLILNSDVSELYDFELSDNLVGAISDGFVCCEPRLYRYVTDRIGAKAPEDYFNAGVLLMNLKKMREVSFQDKFLALLKEVKFDVAQDQDYLNALCKGRCARIGAEWNCMPGFTDSDSKKKLIHYNLDSKPWHKDGVEFSEFFWEYAHRCCFSNEIDEIRKAYTDTAKSEKETLNLITVAEAEANDLDGNEKIKNIVKGIWS